MNSAVYTTTDWKDYPNTTTPITAAQRHNNVNDYIVLSTDISKLDEITNAAEGSTALCTDTGDLYILHGGEWVKFGGDSE